MRVIDFKAAYRQPKKVLLPIKQRYERRRPQNLYDMEQQSRFENNRNKSMEPMNDQLDLTLQ